MFKYFLKLEWKKFRRSSIFQRNLAISILAVFFAIIMIAYFGLIGVAAYFGTLEEFPKENPVIFINKYLIFWFLIDLNYRFFLQKIPFMDVKPMLLQNVRRKSVVRYLLIKSIFSLFNLLPSIFFITFAVCALIDGKSIINILPWLIAMLSIEFSINFLLYLINKSDKIFYLTISLFVGLFALYYFDILDITRYVGKGFDIMYFYPYLVIIPMLIGYVLYKINAKHLLQNFYLDDKFSSKQKVIGTSNLSWLDNFGVMATFLKNDIRLLIRNVRTKQVLILSAFFLLYGLLIYTNDTYSSSDTMMVMFSVFITGGFLMTFGQSVPAWDSEYYKLLMSQNISYYKYLESKWLLMIVSTVVSLVLSLPYLFMGLKFYEIIFATAMFNMGANSYITLIGGIYNKTSIKLNEKAKAFSNSQNFSFSQILIAFPKIFGPIIIFYPFNQFFDFHTGIIALSIFGLIGILMKRPLLKQIEKIYQEEKYETIKAFSE